MAQLEVQWEYSGHLVHLQWGTVYALHAIYCGHCSYTVARYSVHTVVAQWVKRVFIARIVGTLYCFTVGLQCALHTTVRPLLFELGV